LTLLILTEQVDLAVAVTVVAQLLHKTVLQTQVEAAAVDE